MRQVARQNPYPKVPLRPVGSMVSAPYKGGFMECVQVKAINNNAK